MSGHFDAVSAEPKDSLAELARRALDWWLDELRAMVPAKLLARADRRGRFDIDMSLLSDGTISVRSGGTPPRVLSQQDLAAALGELVRADNAHGLTIRLDVPAAWCLVRRSILPRQSLREARKVLLNEMVDTTPLTEDSVHSDWYVEAEDPASGMLHINHVILARDRIAGLTTPMARHGLSFTAITVGRHEERQKPVDLLSADEVGFRTFLKQLPKSAWACWGLAALLVASLPMLASARLDRQIELLHQQRVALMAAAAKHPPLDETSLTEMARLSAAPPLSALLDAVGDHLPREAFLTRLDLIGNRLELRFGAGSTTATVQDLAASKAFAADPAIAHDAVTFHLATDRTGDGGR